MRAVIQRVNSASVSVDDSTVSQIGNGLLVYLGVVQGDSEKDADYIADKILHLRVFQDDDGVNNLSVSDIKGEILIISQFTICADARHGRRPSYSNAERPEVAKTLYSYLCDLCSKTITTKTGIFQAHMHIDSVNDGPITILLDSRRTF